MGDQSTSSNGSASTRSTLDLAIVTKVWKIGNISELMEMCRADLIAEGITFEAGHSIGIPATWQFYFVNSFNDPSVIEGHLCLTSKSEAKVAKASYSCTLSCGDKMIAFMDFDPHEFDKYDNIKGWNYFTKSGILETTDNGKKVLKVTLCLKIFSDKGDKKITKGKTEVVISDLKKMLDSGNGADVEIWVPSEAGSEVDDSSYNRKVHKGILMTRSSVFAKMFTKESTMTEAQTGKVVITDLSPQGLDIFLHYIYTGKVLKDWINFPEEILNAAEKYDCQRLKQYCGRNLITAVSTSNACELFQVAKLHKLSFAKSAIAEFISRNTRAVLGDGDGDGDDVSDEEAGEQGEEEVMGDDV